MFAKTRAKLIELHHDITDLTRSLSRLDDHTEMTLVGHVSRGVKDLARATYLRVRYGSKIVDQPHAPSELRDL